MFILITDNYLKPCCCGHSLRPFHTTIILKMSVFASKQNDMAHFFPSLSSCESQRLKIKGYKKITEMKQQLPITAKTDIIRL